MRPEQYVPQHAVCNKDEAKHGLVGTKIKISFTRLLLVVLRRQQQRRPLREREGKDVYVYLGAALPAASPRQPGITQPTNSEHETREAYNRLFCMNEVGGDRSPRVQQESRTYF